MARDCYKRQNETPSTVKQNTVSLTDDNPTSLTLNKKPELIQFQQFPTFVKRKLEGSSTNDDSDEEKSDGLCKATDKWKDVITLQPEATQSWGLNTKTKRIRIGKTHRPSNPLPTTLPTATLTVRESANTATHQLAPKR